MGRMKRPHFSLKTVGSAIAGVRNRWFRSSLSLRLAILGATALVVGLGYVANRARERREFIRTVHALQCGIVWDQYREDHERLRLGGQINAVEFELLRTKTGLAEVVGPDFVYRIRAVSVYPGIPEADLLRIRALAAANSDKPLVRMRCISSVGKISLSR